MDIELLIRTVIDAAYQVHLALKPGFLESVYQKALMKELDKRGIKARDKQPINVFYGEVNVGRFEADIIVENILILELKAVSHLSEEHSIQLVNYLTATGLDTGLLINFGSQRIEIRRKFRTYDPTKRKKTR